MTIEKIIEAKNYIIDANLSAIEIIDLYFSMVRGWAPTDTAFLKVVEAGLIEIDKWGWSFSIPSNIDAFAYPFQELKIRWKPDPELQLTQNISIPRFEIKEKYNKVTDIIEKAMGKEITQKFIK